MVGLDDGTEVGAGEGMGSPVGRSAIAPVADADSEDIFSLCVRRWLMMVVSLVCCIDQWWCVATCEGPKVVA